MNRGRAANRLSTEPRRSVYGYVDRGDLSEVLNTFDFPNPNTPIGKRYETIVPQQALFLMNSPLVIEQVRNVVNREAFQDAASDDERIQFLYELFFQRPAAEAEIAAGKQFVALFEAEDARVEAAPNAAGRTWSRPQRPRGPGCKGTRSRRRARQTAAHRVAGICPCAAADERSIIYQLSG